MTSATKFITGSVPPLLLIAALLITSHVDAATWTQCGVPYGTLERGARDDQVQFLYLSNCNITNITADDLNGHPNLHSIQLNNNDIPYIDPAVFRDVLEIQDLQFQKNNLRSMPVFGAESVLQNLTHLSITGDEISKLDDPRTFSSTKQLVFIGLSNNKIDYIHPDMFTGLTELREISLRGNKLTYIDDKVFAVPSLNRLKILQISENLIATIAPGAFRNRHLLELYLFKNKLTELPGDFFATGGADLRWFCYHNNPWSCASLEKIRKRKNEVTLYCFHQGDNMECTS